jgi:hypothetical protein
MDTFIHPGHTTTHAHALTKPTPNVDHMFDISKSSVRGFVDMPRDGRTVDARGVKVQGRLTTAAGREIWRAMLWRSRMKFVSRGLDVPVMMM